jgi:adenylate cyclase
MITIGRSADNDIVLYNKLISRKHAELQCASSGSTCHLVDSGSTNGTFLNTARIPADERRQLADGDEISFGPETKVIYLSAEGFRKLLTKIDASNQRKPAQIG